MNNMTSIWIPNNKYSPNTKNYLQFLLLGGGRLVLWRRDYLPWFQVNYKFYRKTPIMGTPMGIPPHPPGGSKIRRHLVALESAAGPDFMAVELVPR